MSAVPFDCSPIAIPEPESCAPSCPMKATSDERRTRTMRAAAPSSSIPATSSRSTSAWPRPLIVSESAPPQAGPAARVGAPRAVDRPGEPPAEGGADGDDDLVLARPALRRPCVFDRRLGSWLPGAEEARIDRVRQPLQMLPALALAPVARAGPCVRVRIVDCRHDPAAGIDDRRGLEIVGRHALPLHL